MLVSLKFFTKPLGFKYGSNPSKKQTQWVDMDVDLMGQDGLGHN